MIKFEEIKRLYNFEPKYTFSQLKETLPQWMDTRTQKINDSRLYKAVKALTEKAYPTEEDEYDKRWFDFYLPLKRKGFFILIPLSIVLYNNRFFLSFPNSEIEVCKGKEKNKLYRDLIKQILMFSRILKKDPEIAAKAIPYDIRTGRILGKYVLENLFPADEKKEILKLYKDHIKKRKRSHGVSLHDYLETSAICYRASFGDKTKGLTAEQMYRMWADGRNYGMLEIKDRKSKAAFRRWLYDKSHRGGHPFEIVRGLQEFGIHLFPPYMNPYFILRVANYIYAMPFLEMVKALIRKRVPFIALDLESVLDYLSGESYFTINAYAKHSIYYDPSDRRLLKHIEWDDPKMLKWK